MKDDLTTCFATRSPQTIESGNLTNFAEKNIQTDTCNCCFLLYTENIISTTTYEAMNGNSESQTLLFYKNKINLTIN